MNKLILFLFFASLFAISCATKKTNSAELSSSQVASGELVKVQSIDGLEDKGMLIYTGASPSDMLEQALNEKNVDNIVSLLSHTFSLDYVTKSGKTIREVLRESGDEALVRIANGVDKINTRPEGVYY